MQNGRRPDGGWGWVVSIATFLTNVIVDGVKYSFGVMFVEIVEAFKSTKSETSMIISIQVGVCLLTGPIVAALVNRFGCRKVALVGTGVSFAGFLGSVFVTSLNTMYATFGFIAGFGFGMMTMPMVVVLARFFDRKLALASGIASMGSGFGTLLFNPLSKLLIDLFTWRGMLLIESAIILNGVACGLVLRDPDPSLQFEHDEEIVSLKSMEITNVDGTTDQQTDKLALVKSALKEPREKDIREDKYFTKETILADAIPDSAKTDLLLKPTPDPEQAKPKNATVVEKIENGIDKESIRRIDKASEANFSERFIKTTDDMQEYHVESSDKTDEICETMTFIDKNDKQKIEKTTRKKTASTRRWFTLVPLKSPRFVLFLLSNVLIELALYVPFTFLPDMMIYKGFQKEDAVFMLFLIGVVSTVCRLVIGFVADLRFVDRVKLCNSLVVFNGILVILCAFCNNYATFVAFSVFFGFSAGSSSALRYVLIPDLFGVEMIADFYGLTMFFAGIAAFSGLPKAGALFDVNGTYTLPFVLAGAELILSGLILFIIPLVNRKKNR